MKKMKFLRVLSVMMLCGVAAVLVSCGGKEKIDRERTIIFYNTMGKDLQVPLDKTIKSYETKFPGWKVKSVKIGGYDAVKERIVSGFQSNSQPDLAYCYPDHVAQYLSTKKVVDLNKFIKNQDKLTVNLINDKGEYVPAEQDEIVGYTDAEVKDFVKGYWEEGHATNYADYEEYGFTADSMLTVPFQKSTEILYYNKTALNQLGAEVPTTWDELWEVAKLAKEKWPKSIPLGYDSEANWFIITSEQNGWGYTSATEPHYLFNNEGTAGWLGQLKEYMDEGLFTTKSIFGNYTSNLFTKGIDVPDAKDPKKKVYGSLFSIGSSGGASHQAPQNNLFEWGVAPLPGSKRADGTINNSNISQGPSLVMLETSAKNQEEKQLMTWEFVKMLLEPTNQAAFAGTTGYMPARLSAYDVPDYAALLEDPTNIAAATAKVAKSMTDSYFVSPAFNGSSNARGLVGSALVNAVMGIKTPEQALKEAYRKCGGK